MHFDVAQESHARPAPEIAVRRGEQDQGQPGDERDHDHAAARELERVARHVRPAQQLEERAAEDDRKVARVRRRRGRRAAHRAPFTGRAAILRS